MVPDIKNNNWKDTVRCIAKTKLPAFSGRTHLNLSLFVLLILAYLNSPYVGQLRTSIGLFVLNIFVLSGAALWPDIDNDISTIKCKLGIVGDIIKSFMDIMSSLAFSILHGRGDKRPPGGGWHRMLFHTPFAALVIGATLWWSIPSYSGSITDDYTILKHSGVSIMLFLIFVCSWLSFSVLFYKVVKFITSKLARIIPIIFGILAAIYAASAIDSSQMKLLAVVFSIGWLLHVLEDALTQGSAAIFFPIPIKGQFWYKPWVLGPFQIWTGGIVDTLLGWGLFAVNLVLAYFIFFT